MKLFILRNNKQRGFSLIGILIGIVIVGVMTWAMDPYSWFKAKAKIDTDHRLNELNQAISAAYKHDALLIDSTDTAIFRTSAGTIDPVLPVASRCTPANDALSAIARYSTTSASLLVKDGYMSPLCVFISPRLERIFQGTPIAYHAIAVVATAANGKLDTTAGCGTSGLDSSGNLRLCGDDRGTLVDGFQIQVAALQKTQHRISQLISAYQAYFSARFLADGGQDISIDYFAHSGNPDRLWDKAISGAVVPSSGCTGTIPIPDGFLGFSHQDLLDGYGQKLQFDNCSPSVRSPANPNASMKTAPFTARISATLPHGEVISQTATSTF